MGTHTFEKDKCERDAKYRLKEDVRPERYDIHLDCDLKTFTFSGDETITLDIASAQEKIVLNALDLDIKSALLYPEGGSKENGEKLSIKLDPELERVELSAQNKITVGKYNLSISFTGTINDKLRGFYRSAQLMPNGEKNWIGLTQFEATDARRAFPSFDEPEFKSVFQLSLTVDKSLTAISNTPVVSEEETGNGKKKISFKPTMKMSTYIVAFVIGQFEVSQAVDVDGIPMRIYAPLGKLALTSFSLEIGAAALSFFNKYYGIPYPGEKMDMIAVPDFAFGAMENLGAVIYRENALLVDPKAASHAELERVADVVAHELAHMWFGNLTTMKWWNGIWLNEAFATFMELVAVDNWKPQWKRWETFGVSRAAAFATDGLTATRKIEFPVIKPEEANGMFDVLTYEKGASVLRMLEQYIGAAKFKEGVNLYLSKHKFANTETHDLWDALGESAGEPVQDIMNSWIFQEGHPLVKVELAADKRTVKMSQERFFYLPEAAAKLQDKTVFQVPLLLKALTKDGIKESRYLLNAGQGEYKFDADVQAVLANAGGHGFYRVLYETSLLEKLKEAMAQSYKKKSSEDLDASTLTLNTLERFNLVNDLWALTVNGSVRLDEFFDFIKLAKLESDKNVWSVIVSALQYVDRVFPQDRKQVNELTKELLRPTYECLGFEEHESDSEQVKQMRGLTIQALGTTGDDKDVQTEAAKRYEAHKAGKALLGPDVLTATVFVLASCGDAARYEEFSDAFRQAKSPQESDRYMYSMAMFADAALLQKTLDKTLTGEVRSQNAPYLVRNVLLNPAGRTIGWEWVKTNWDKIRELFPSLIITRLVEGVSGLIDEKIADDVDKFFASHPVKEGQKTCDQHLEKLKVAIAFLRRERK